MADTSITVRLIDETRAGLTRIQQQIGGVEQSTRKTATAMDGLKKAALGFVAAIGVGQVGTFLSNIQTLDNRIKLVTNSQTELNDTFNVLLGIANRSRGDLAGVVDLYTKIALSTKDLGLAQEQVAQVTETFAKALAISGAETAAAEGAIRQFGQALASGAFRGDEFNSVVEAAPIILDILAKETGKARGEIRALASDGKLTADVLISALTNASEDIDASFGKTTITIGQAVTKLQNNFTALGRSATPVANAIARSIEVLADNLDAAIAFAGAFIATFAIGKMATIAGSVGGITKAVLALNVAIRANPIGLIATGVATAAALIIANFDDIKAAVNNFGTRATIIFNQVKLALLKALDGTPFFDFSKEIANTEKRISGLQKELVDMSKTQATANKVTTQHTNSIEDNTKTLEDNTDAVKDAVNAIDDSIEKIKTDTKALELNEKQRDTVNSIIEQENRLRKALGDTVSQLSQKEIQAIQDAVRNENFAQANFLRISNDKIQKIQEYQEQHAATTATIEANEERQRQAEAATLAFTTKTNELLKQNYEETTTEVKKLEDQKQAYIQAAREQGKLGNEQVQRAILEFDRQIAQEQMRIDDEKTSNIRKRAADFRNNELNAFGKYNAQRKELDDLLQQGIKVNEQDRLDFMRAINSEYVDNVTREFDDLYGFFEGRIKEFTGLTDKEFGIMEEIIQLAFGVNATDIIKNSFASMLQSVVGFKNGTNNEMITIQGIFGSIFGNNGTAKNDVTNFASTGLDVMDGFGNSTESIFSKIGSFISNVFSNISLGGITDFVSSGFSLIADFAGGITDVLGGVGNFILDNFSGLFNSIKSGASSLISAVGSIFGRGGGGGGGTSFSSIASTVASFIPGLGPVVGGAIGAIGKIFGFADGGVFQNGAVKKFANGGIVSSATMFPMANGMGLMGEAGPEAIMPLTRSSTGELGVKSSGGGPVNVNLTINTIDAQGFEELLVSKRQYITNLVRSAVADRGRSLY